jgi:hypothetical protein
MYLRSALYPESHIGKGRIVGGSGASSGGGGAVGQTGGGVSGSRVGQEDSRLLPRSQVQKGELICIHAIIRSGLQKDGKII